MRYPDDRRRLRPLVDAAIEAFVAASEDGRIEPHRLQEHVKSTLTVTFPARERHYFEERFTDWIKKRWETRRAQDGKCPAETAWEWVPSNEYQQVSPGYHVQIGRADSAELGRVVQRVGLLASVHKAHREAVQGVIASRSPALRQRKVRSYQR